MNRHVAVRVEGRCGRITLNRPEALNALTHSMALAIDQALADWAEDPAITCVVLDAEGERAFCAGGDITWLYECGLTRSYERATQFWRDEYRLNERIARYTKPVVAFMRGIVMGGGVGLSAHASHRIVTDGTRVAMPECAIGLIPDVGGSLLLAKAPGHIGEYLGLTGHRMGPEDAIFCGFADHFVSAENWDSAKQALLASGDPTQIKPFLGSLPTSAFASDQNRIDAIFSDDSLSEIADRLLAERGEWHTRARKLFDAGSPISLQIAFQTLRAARRHNDIHQALKHELRFVSRALEHGDFQEGIRATVIDKDKAAKWRHDTIETVSDELLQLLGSPTEGGDLAALD